MYVKQKKKKEKEKKGEQTQNKFSCSSAKHPWLNTFFKRGVSSSVLTIIQQDLEEYFRPLGATESLSFASCEPSLCDVLGLFPIVCDLSALINLSPRGCSAARSLICLVSLVERRRLISYSSLGMVWLAQERAARPWQQDSAGPKLQEAGKIC